MGDIPLEPSGPRDSNDSRDFFSFFFSDSNERFGLTTDSLELANDLAEAIESVTTSFGR